MTQNVVVEPDFATVSPAWLAQLGDFSAVAVTGPDGQRFLQGQLSCNMMLLSAKHSLRGALCNLKGRVIADMQVLLDGDRILLLCQRGMAEVVLATLNKYKVFFKTELQEITDQLVVLGIGGEQCEQALLACGIEPPAGLSECAADAGQLVYRAAGEAPRFCCILGDAGAALAAELSSRCESVSEEYWQMADIRAGLAHIRPGQQELYTPQVLNYDITGVIDFKKGCYTGQEIVARMHYRAEAKKRLQYIRYGKANEPASGNDAATNGEIVNYVEYPKGSIEALAIVQVDAPLDTPGD